MRSGSTGGHWVFESLIGRTSHPLPCQWCPWQRGRAIVYAYELTVEFSWIPPETTFSSLSLSPLLVSGSEGHVACAVPSFLIHC